MKCTSNGPSRVRHPFGTLNFMQSARSWPRDTATSTRARAQARHPPLARARTPSISCGGATSFIGDVGQVGSSWLVYFGLTSSPPRLSGQFWTVYVRVTDSPVFKWIDEELNEGDNAAERRRRRRPWRRPLQKDGSHCRGDRRSFRSR